MGCSASKAETFVTKDKHSSSVSSSSVSQCACSAPLSRTLSLPASFVHHPPKAKGDTEHLVSLTSTTYGVLSLPQGQDPNFMDQEMGSRTTHVSEFGDICVCDCECECGHSVINTWELMEDLDEFLCDFESVEKIRGGEVDEELTGDYEIVEYKDSKPLWQHLSVESLLANMDPNVGKSYRRALRSKRFESSEMKDVVKEGVRGSELDCESKKGIVEVDLSRKEFDGKELHERGSRKWSSELNVCGVEDKIVLYYTSVRGIRKTYQDCCEVRMIFRGYRVFVDERDTSMDQSYRKELQDMLKGKEMSLPQVFVKGEYIGGADKIRKLHEAGDLGEILKGFPIFNLAVACERCGDARFVLCLNCNGSRKVFEENKEKMRCLDCNENGLVRCPSC